MNIEKIISTEQASIARYKTEAIAQYNNQQYDAINNVSPDHRILFVLVENLNIRGTSYLVTDTDRDIFYAAIENFVCCVENFTNKNVHIIPSTLCITDQVSVSVADENYLIFEDIQPYLEKEQSLGLYDSVMVLTHHCSIGGITTTHMFQMPYTLHGFSHTILSPGDPNRLIYSDDKDYPYLYTTYLIMHEWLHQIAAGYRNSLGVVVPFVHAYKSDMVPNPTEPWQRKNNFHWDTTFFDNTTSYPHLISAEYKPALTLFRAMLACEVTYTPDSAHSYTRGIYPLFWRLEPCKVHIGHYIIQNSSNSSYVYLNNNQYDESPTLANTEYYIFSVYYSLSNNAIKIINTYLSGNPSLNLSNLSSYAFTRVGPYRAGEYYYINTTLSNQVLGMNVSQATYFPYMYNYRVALHETYHIRHYQHCYYYVKADGIDKYLDLCNNSDSDGTQVQLFVLNSQMESAQTWQMREMNGNYKVHPLISPTRSLAFYNSNLRICAYGNSNAQTWKFEKKDNGKFLFEGQYKIKDASGKYLKDGGGMTLSFANTGTTWNVEYYSDNYYKIYTKRSGVKYYFDVQNAYDIENNSIILYTATSYTDAQTWKILHQSDGTNDTYLIVPRLSLTRGITKDNTSTKLTASPTPLFFERVSLT